MKDRIKNILNYKKPSLWVILVVILLSVFLLVGFMTDPVSNNKTDKKQDKVETVVSEDDDTKDTTNDTSTEHSTPDENIPIESEPTESEPTESKPVESNPSASKPQDTLSTPQNIENSKPQDTVSSTPTNTVEIKPAKQPNYSGGNTDEFLDSLPVLIEKEKQEILARRGEIDKKLEVEVKQAYVDRWAGKGYDFSVEKVTIRKYYGTYNDAAVVKIIGAPVDYYQSVWTHQVEGITFLYPDSNYIVVYKDNGFYNLQEAYDEGILTIDDLKKIQIINGIIF